MLAAARNLWKLASPLGWMYRDAVFFAVDVALDARVAKAWVPPGARLARPATATVFAAHFPWTTFGSVYDEAGIFFHVKRRLRSAVFCPWMVVTDDVALISGRELLGYPKKLATIDFRIEGTAVRAEVARRGRRVLGIRGELGPSLPDPPPMLGQRALNVRGAIGPGAQRLVSFRPKERIVEARSASAELVIPPAAAGDDERRDALGDLGLGRVLRARLLRVDIGMAVPPHDVRRVGLPFALRALGARFL